MFAKHRKQIFQINLTAYLLINNPKKKSTLRNLASLYNFMLIHTL